MIRIHFAKTELESCSGKGNKSKVVMMLRRHNVTTHLNLIFCANSI